MTGFVVEKEPRSRPAGPDDPDARLPKLGYKGVESTELVSTAFASPPRASSAAENGVGQGFKYFMSGIEVGRVNVAARGVGVAQGGARTTRLAYAARAEAFGKPIASHQAVQLMLAKMATRAEAARLLTMEAARKKASGERADLEAGMAKYFGDRGRAGERPRLHADPRRLRVLDGVRPSATTATRLCC
jgi:butyryl-CoA dehydrogenase